jgi:hypothetical protein
MNNYELDNENNYCPTEAEYKRMLDAIDQIKADSNLNIEETISDIESLIFDLHKRPACDAKKLQHDVDDYIERLINCTQYLEMLAHVMANVEFKPMKFPKSYIEKRKKEFLKHVQHLERDMINV